MIFNISLKKMNKNSQHNYTHNITCHIIYLPADQVYYRYILVIICFLIFHFSTIIAYKSEAMTGIYTIYGVCIRSQGHK